MVTNKIIGKYKSLPVQVRASFWFLICSFLQKAISMLTTPIFTRIMSTEEYGEFNIFFSWLGIITIFVSLNLYYGVYTQGLVKYSDDRKVFSSSMQGLSALLCGVWFVIYLVTHNIWNKLFGLSTIQMIAMFSMIWTTAVFGFWSSEQRVDYKYRNLVIITVIVSVVKPAIGIFLVLHSNDKVTARILGLAAVELIAYTGLFIAQIRRGKKLFSNTYWKHALLFNLPLIPHYLSQTVLNSSDRIMIGRMVGDSEAGIYSLAYALASIMILFNNALSQTINPWMYKKIKDKRDKDIAPIAYITLIMIASVNLLLIAFAPEAVAIFAPKTYHEAIYVIPPVAMSVFFMYAYDLFAKHAFYFEKTYFIMIASVSGAALNIVLNYIFIKVFGYIAAGYTTLVCFAVYTLCHYIFMKKVCRECCGGEYPYENKILIFISSTFVVLGFTLLFTYDWPVIRYSLICISFIIIFIKRNTVINTIRRVLSLKRKEE